MSIYCRRFVYFPVLACLVTWCRIGLHDRTRRFVSVGYLRSVGIIQEGMRVYVEASGQSFSVAAAAAAAAERRLLQQRRVYERRVSSGCVCAWCHCCLVAVIWLARFSSFI